jgi:tripeptidyl-peptidase-1
MFHIIHRFAGGKLLQGASNPNDSTEANLDIQYTVGLTHPLRNNYYSTAGRGLLIPDLDQPTQADNQNEPYLEYFSYLMHLSDDDLPHTISTSYGEDEQSVPANYSRVVCNMIGQLGARGTTVLFSSGDTGVGSACQTNDGKNTTRFLPTFPASCPYVTSVGGTHYVNPESAVSFSSGGFSDRFPRPWWQEYAVSNYLEILGDKWKGLYNPYGRGIPDISAQGRYFQVVDKGRVVRVSGTSASAPAVSAIIALLNAARLQSGQPPFGFLNPWLYTRGFKALTDIVNGGSTGCTGTDQYSGLKTPFVPYASWNATKGWDPVTGLGTPLFDGLLKLAAPRLGRYDSRVKRGRT